MAAVDQETGLIQVYSSPSGKMNFAPFGLALRASGYGLRTLITRFVHHELERGEKRAVATLAPNLVIDTSALKGPADSAMVEDGIKEAFQKAEHAAVSGAYDLAVLVTGKTMQEVAGFVSRKLSTLDHVQGTVTHFLLKRYKEDGEIFEGEERPKRQPLTL